MPASEQIKAWPGRKVLPLLVLAIAGLALFAQSYQKWGDPIVDLGRDLYVPGRLLSGAWLYRDVIYNYGPLTPYGLAAVEWLFGDRLVVFEACGLLVGVGTVWAIYAIGARIGSRTVAFIAALLFLTFSFFARSTFGCNFVLPYSFAATASVLCALWSFYFLLRSLETGGSAARWLSICWLLAALLSKSEVGAAMLVVHLAAWIISRPGWRFVAAAAGAGVGTAAICLLLFHARSPEEHALLKDSIARLAGNANASAFFASVAGTSWTAERLREHAGALGEVMALVALGWVAIRWPARGRWPRALSVAAAAGFVAATAMWGDLLLFRAVLPIAAGAFLYCVAVDCRSPLLYLALLVLATAPRIVLSYTPDWYGFYLAVPAYLFVPYVFVTYLPRTSRTRIGAAIALTIVVGAVVSRAEYGMWREYRGMTSLLATSKGDMFDDPTGRAEAIDALLAYLPSLPGAPHATAVVFPEGVTLNYFTGLRNPTAYYSFIPPEIASEAEEQRMLGELRQAAPDYVILVDRDTREFGRAGFGIDYALALGAWIQDAYELDRPFGFTAPGRWGLFLLRRKTVR